MSLRIKQIYLFNAMWRFFECIKNWESPETIEETMKCIDKYNQKENKQTGNYPTDMKP